MKKKLNCYVAIAGLTCLTLVGCGSGGTSLTKPDTNGSAKLDNNFRHTVALGHSHIAAIKKDGTVVATGNNEFGQCDVEDWTDIVSLDATSKATIGLKSDGTVVTAGSINFADFSQDENVSNLSVSSIGGYAYVLKSDGQDAVHGTHYYTLTTPPDWDEVRYVLAANRGTLGLKQDGTVTFAENNYPFAKTKTESFYKMSNWSDIQQLAIGAETIFGLTNSGQIQIAFAEPYRDHFTGNKDDRFYKVTGSSNSVYALSTEGEIEYTYLENNNKKLLYKEYLDNLNSKESSSSNKDIYIADIEGSDNTSMIAEILSNGTLHLEDPDSIYIGDPYSFNSAETWTDLMVIDRTK